MTNAILSNRAEISTFTFVREIFTGLRRRRAKIALRKHLLDFDDRMLRDIGVARFDAMGSRFRKLGGAN